MVDHGSSHEELRLRGLELQAAVPEPTGWGSRWADRRRQPSEGAEVAAGTLDLALEVGPWAMLLAIPGVIIWIVRRVRHRAG
jgi:hypothetical protein